MNNKVRQRVKAIQERFRQKNLSWTVSKGIQMSKTKEPCIVCGHPDSEHDDGYCPGGARPYPCAPEDNCTHPDVPFKKSAYSDEMLQLGFCYRCQCQLIELD